MPFDTITLCGAHSIIRNHVPNKLPLAALVDDRIEKFMEVDKFGLFDASSPNYTTYYPDVTPEDFVPKAEDFVQPVFRLLSNVTVNKLSNPIYFPADILKASMQMLVGQTINVDHETATGNAIGVVSDVFWQESYKDPCGVTVPAGINGKFMIDAKSNPRLARGMMMTPPSIHSNSVTINFSWEKSHPKMTDEEFWGALGTTAKDGQLVQRVANGIRAYFETSVVPHGADPFAQQVRDGKIVNPGYPQALYGSFSSTDTTKVPKAEKESQKFFTFNYKDTESFKQQLTIPNSLDNIHNNNQNHSEMNEALLLFLTTTFGFKAGDVTEENYQELVRNAVTGLRTELDTAKALQTQVTELSQKATALETEVGTLKSANASLTAEAEIGKETVSHLRIDALRLYGITAKTPDANIQALINTSDFKTVKALHAQYDKLTEGMFRSSCTKCGSTDITRASAQMSDPEGGGGSGTPHAIKTNAELIAENRTNRRHTGILFQGEKK
jgi:hypothetical protein